MFNLTYVFAGCRQCRTHTSLRITTTVFILIASTKQLCAKLSLRPTLAKLLFVEQSLSITKASYIMSYKGWNSFLHFLIQYFQTSGWCGSWNNSKYGYAGWSPWRRPPLRTRRVTSCICTGRCISAPRRPRATTGKPVHGRTGALRDSQPQRASRDWPSSWGDHCAGSITRSTWGGSRLTRCLPSSCCSSSIDSRIHDTVCWSARVRECSSFQRKSTIVASSWKLKSISTLTTYCQYTVYKLSVLLGVTDV